MNIQNKVRSDIATQLGQNFGSTVRDLHTPARGNSAEAHHKAAWAQFERVLVKLGSPAQATGPEAAAAQAAQKSFQEQFGALAADKEKFHALMKEVYGENYNAEAAEGYRLRALGNDYSWLPKIEFKSNSVLAGGNGAYDASRNVVYINEKYLNDPTRAAQVYSEEVGAFLDTKLNTSDSVGDEGEMFRKLLAGQNLTDAEKAAIRADNDHGVITVNGKATEVEYSFLDDIGDAVSDVGDAIADGAKAVGDAISDGAKAVGNAIADGAKAVGNFFADGAKVLWDGIKGFGEFMWDGIKMGADWVWDAAKWTGNKLYEGAKKVGGAAWKGLKWVGNGIADAAKWFGPRAWDGIRGLGLGIKDALVGIGKNLIEAGKTFGKGFVQVFKGDFEEGFKNMGKGLLKVPQTAVDAVLMVGGRAISAIQTMVGLEPVGRKLRDDEIAELRKVYGDSIDYSSVRIKEGDAGLLGLGGTAFTHGDTIYIPKDSLPLSKELLVHEMGHVWQHQNGGTDYMGEALWAQKIGDGYDWKKGVAEGKSWSELNPEQQCEMLEEAYRSGFFNNPGGRFMVGSADYTAYLNDALQQIRRGEGAT